MNTARIRWLFLLIPLTFGFNIGQPPAAPAQISITFIDVGQGDATLIRDAAGFDILVDGGNKSAGKEVLRTINSAGVDDLEIVLATHADRDHIGGLIYLLESDEVLIESIYYNGYPGDTLTWQEFTAAAAADGLQIVPLQYPANQTWGDFSIEVLNPPADLVDPDQNQASIVLLVAYAQIRVLLPADIDSSLELILDERTASLLADLLKVAHHGSIYSTSEFFLDAVQPAEAVVSVGLNSYDHPAPETMQRLENFGARIWRTDLLGNITMISDGSTYEMFPKIYYLPLFFRLATAPISHLSWILHIFSFQIF